MEIFCITAEKNRIMLNLNNPDDHDAVCEAREKALAQAKGMVLPGFNVDTMACGKPGVPAKFGADRGVHITLRLEYDGTFDEETIAKANALNDTVKNKVCHFSDADIEFIIGSVEHIDEVGGFLYVSSKLTNETKAMINGWIEEIFGETESGFTNYSQLVS